MNRHIATAADCDTRLDVYACAVTGISRSAIQKLITSGDILVNSKPTRANYRVQVGDFIDVFIPAPTETSVLPEAIPLTIAYEDADLIVLDKPKGMVVHPAPGHYSGTVVNALLFHCKGSLSGIGGVMRPGIVHRIDKDTSGLIVAAKNDHAHQTLAAQFANHTITREYYAIVHGGFNDNSGTIDKPIARHKLERKKMAVTTDGKRAVTHFTVIEKAGRFSLVKCTLETGRTHQIRVHMASIGHPVLGDVVYGTSKQPFDTQGQVLHARKLGFTHPAGHYLEFESDLPPYFVSIMQKLGLGRL